MQSTPSSAQAINYIQTDSKSRLQWLLVDLNSFFASCEQQDRPELRGQPVAVVPMLSDTTSVIAASMEAKRFGIKTGTRVSEAKKMCPRIQFVTGGHKKYVEYHHKIIEAVDEICPVEKVLSIDEMACRLMGRECEYNNAIEIARKIKRQIESKVGECLTTSIGLGPNILIAKIASDLQKPNGLVPIPTDKIRDVLGPLDVNIIPGVGSKTKVSLNAKGFYKVSDLMDVSSNQLRQVWGSIWGLRVGEELRGADLARDVNDSQSYSHEHVLPPDLRTRDGAYQILVKLLSKAGARIRKNKRKTRLLGVSIKFTDQSHYEKTVQFHTTDDSMFLIRQLRQLYPFDLNKRPLKVGVVLGGLTTEGEDQLSFFDNPKNTRLNKAMDLINDKFGANTLVSASFLDVKSQAKVKISFNHIPDKEDEF